MYGVLFVYLWDDCQPIIRQVHCAYESFGQTYDCSSATAIHRPLLWSSECASDVLRYVCDVTVAVYLARRDGPMTPPSAPSQLLTRRLAERTRQVEQLTRRAEDAENETAIVRKKHNSSVRVSTSARQSPAVVPDMFRLLLCLEAVVVSTFSF